MMVMMVMSPAAEPSGCPYVILYIYIELEPTYKQTIFAKNQPSSYETYAKL